MSSRSKKSKIYILSFLFVLQICWALHLNLTLIFLVLQFVPTGHSSWQWTPPRRTWLHSIYTFFSGTSGIQWDSRCTFSSPAWTIPAFSASLHQRSASVMAVLHYSTCVLRKVLYGIKHITVSCVSNIFQPSVFRWVCSSHFHICTGNYNIHK